MKNNVKYIPMGTTGGWKKVLDHPVIGPEYGTTFDVQVLYDENVYKMWFSWRNVRLIAYCQSEDGIHWGAPTAVLTAVPGSAWEGMEVNRPTVLKRGDTYHMWYTGQMFALENQAARSCIGYATSKDGLHWQRREQPVLVPEEPWEKYCTMCPHVIWDAAEALYKMWYSAGRMEESDAIGYATSPDGIQWKKYPANPVFTPDSTHFWEMTKVEACFVLKEAGWYYMFYMGMNGDGNSAMGLARSRNGITQWERHPDNPIIAGTDGLWDWRGICKPSVLPSPDGYLLWYNGANDYGEQIGLARHTGKALFPAPGAPPERGTAKPFDYRFNYYYHRPNMLQGD